MPQVGILAYTPLMAGLLSGKYTDAASVPEGRQRTKHFNYTRTERCYHGGPGAEEETFRFVFAFLVSLIVFSQLNVCRIVACHLVPTMTVLVYLTAEDAECCIVSL